MIRFLCLAVALGAFCVLIAGASAKDYNYDVNLPGIWLHITLVDGVKSSDRANAKNYPGNCDVRFTCWIDAEITKNNWLPVTADYTFFANKAQEMKYSKVIPRYGTKVRLRTKSDALVGGKKIVGKINFDYKS